MEAIHPKRPLSSGLRLATVRHLLHAGHDPNAAGAYVWRRSLTDHLMAQEYLVETPLELAAHVLEQEAHPRPSAPATATPLHRELRQIMLNLLEAGATPTPRVVQRVLAAVYHGHPHVPALLWHPLLKALHQAQAPWATLWAHAASRPRSAWEHLHHLTPVLAFQLSTGAPGDTTPAAV